MKLETMTKAEIVAMYYEERNNKKVTDSNALKNKYLRRIFR